MTIKAAIVDLLTGRTAHVGVDGGLLTRSLALPEPGQEGKASPVSEFFTNPAGSSSMNVDGSVTPVDFDLRAIDERDRYVKTIVFSIVDANATLSEFGDLPALANGVQFEWSLRGQTVVIEDALRTNFDFIRLAGGAPAFGDGMTAFRASDVVGTSEGYIAALDLEKQFGLPFGLRLGPQTDERLTIRVRDDLSTVDSFTAKAHGFDLSA